MSATATTPQRTWMKVGARYTTCARRPQVLAELERLQWHVIAEQEGPTMSLPFSQGEAIKAVIRELRLPKVTAVAYNGALEFPGQRVAGGERADGEYPGLYGIEANYRNGRVRLYMVDNGCAILPVISDFWPATE